MDMYIPKVKLRSCHHPKWFNSHIRHQIKCIRTLRRKTRHHFTTSNLHRLINAEDSLQHSLFTAKSNYELNLINSYARSKDPNVFHYLKNLAKSDSVPPALQSDSTVLESDIDKANAFNEYFYSVFTQSSFTLPDVSELPSVPDSLSNISFTLDDIYQALLSLQPNKASGLDNIGPRIIKNCADSLVEPLHHLFSLSLNCMDIPVEWKQHTIVPVFKSGDKTNLRNYRPISLLSSISKVLERLVCDRVTKFISDSIFCNQFGFQKHKSTLQQLLLYFNDLCSSNNTTDTIYLDFTKAFDSVPHNELLFKLWSTGITGNLWLWFKSYLTNRTQRVSINNCLSDLLPVTSGVPQGSILGPILFIIYINDLPSVVIHSKLLLFADDAKCYRSIHNPLDSHSLQLDLDSLTIWSHKNHLYFKPAKCNSIRFRPNPHSPEENSYSVDNCIITDKFSYCDLGIIFSANLSWRPHYEHIVAKAYRALGLLRHTFKHSSSTQVKKALYLHVVRSCLLYCSPLWKPYLVQDIILLERVQRRSSKFILNDYSSDYKTRLAKLNLLPLMYIYELTDILFFIKSLKTPTYSFDITKYVSFTRHNTRSSDTKLCHQVSTNNITANSYFFRLPRLWNSLPIVDLSLPYNVIKKKLLLFFWNHFIANFDSNNNCTLHFLCPCHNCAKSPHTFNFNKL